MADDRSAVRPRLYTIASHRGFADALVAGLLARYAKHDVSLARLILLLPSRRSVRIVTEAFIRSQQGLAGRYVGGEGSGMLLPRMVVVGDLDLDEIPGTLLDPLDVDVAIPAAVDPLWRWLKLAELIREDEGSAAPRGAALLRRAREAAMILDRLAVEDISVDRLLGDDILALIGEQAAHWKASTRRFLRLEARWRTERTILAKVDPPERRNLLFAAAARRWADCPPSYSASSGAEVVPYPVVAAGITSASPALARLLREVSQLPDGAVVFPDLDLELDKTVWDQLGAAGIASHPGGPCFTYDDAPTHPQYHLKLLLNRMGVAREEVRAWHRSGMGSAPPERAHAISNLFLPASASAGWAALSESRRRLAGVRLMETAHGEEEAQAIALLLREALETPEKRAALVTPDRGLAARVIAHLRRWGIVADDTAGVSLVQTAAGRLLLLLAEVMSEDAPPVSLIALLGHPLVRAGSVFGGEVRAAWLEQLRHFDLALRGPRPDAGLGALRALAESQRQKHSDRAVWWAEVEAILAPLFSLDQEDPLVAPLLAEQLRALATAGEALCGEALWSQSDGRALAQWLDGLSEAAEQVGSRVERRELVSVLRDAMADQTVRPAWGGHPRIAIYGLIEARMARADLMVCGGMVETVWPASPAPDPLIPPAVLRHLGVPVSEFRIGLAAHDLAAVLGAKEVVLSWARRDASGPVIPSRFVRRLQAMLGTENTRHRREHRIVDLARVMDRSPAVAAHPQPKPMPSPEQRRVLLSATGLDRLRGDPYQFYASSILGLRRLDGLDAEPSPAWRGTAVHAILDTWHKYGSPQGRLVDKAHEVLDTMSAHPLSRVLWQPRLLAALAWVDEAIAAQKASGRKLLVTEAAGSMVLRGVTVQARADRIDRNLDGTLAIVDYKTGKPPSNAQVQNGFALQLGLVGLIARAGGFVDVSGEPVGFEYWSLTRRANDKGFGWWSEPVLEGRKKTGIVRDRFLDETARYLDDALDRWILGNEPFTARLNPDLGGYNDFDQLMRLDEWFGLQVNDTKALRC